MYWDSTDPGSVIPVHAPNASRARREPERTNGHVPAHELWLSAVGREDEVPKLTVDAAIGQRGY